MEAESAHASKAETEDHNQILDPIIEATILKLSTQRENVIKIYTKDDDPILVLKIHSEIAAKRLGVKKGATILFHSSKAIRVRVAGKKRILVRKQDILQVRKEV